MDEKDDKQEGWWRSGYGEQIGNNRDGMIREGMAGTDRGRQRKARRMDGRERE